MEQTIIAVPPQVQLLSDADLERYAQISSSEDGDLPQKLRALLGMLDSGKPLLVAALINPCGYRMKTAAVLRLENAGTKEARIQGWVSYGDSEYGMGHPKGLARWDSRGGSVVHAMYMLENIENQDNVHVIAEVAEQLVTDTADFQALQAAFDWAHARIPM